MKKILIVEDNKDILKALTILLKSSNYQVDTAEDVIQGLNRVVKNTPDLMLLDISLPAGNGFLLAERVNALPDIKKIPVIFLTAHKNPELQEQARNLGAAAFFEKPFDSSILLDEINLVLKS